MIRNFCREKYGQKWWDVSPELKKKRREEAKKTLAKPKPSRRPKIVRELANQHLPDALQWPSRKTALGHCVYQPSAIFLSSIYIKAAQTTIESVTMTILHEIARTRFNTWRRTWYIVEGNGVDRCVDAFAKPTYIVICPCGFNNFGCHRKTNLSNKICTVCRGKLEYKNN